MEIPIEPMNNPVDPILTWGEIPGFRAGSTWRWHSRGRLMERDMERRRSTTHTMGKPWENGGLMGFDGDVPSGKRLHSYGQSPFSMGKLNIAMFNSYVELTEGKWTNCNSKL